MMNALTPAMIDAMRRTRAGDLSGATDVIRAMLTGGAAAPSPALPGETITLTPERVRVSAKRGGGGQAGAFLDQSYSGPAGTLGYLLHVPPRTTAGMPLVVMLHGCTQSPEDFARGTGMNLLADEFGVLVAYPRQTQAANAQKCWNWFNARDQQRDHGEPALIAGATRAIVAEHAVDPDRVYVAGLSAGGAAAAIMAARYPDLYAAAGIHSGLACGAARDLPGALMAMKQGAAAAGSHPFVPVITFHGDRDRTVHEVNSRQIIAAAASAAGIPLETVTDSGRGAGGRGYTRVSGVDASGRVLVEQWTIHGAGHAWSGGDGAGSYTDPGGPDASREMLRFFLDHPRAG